jgi:hypothetical protein
VKQLFFINLKQLILWHCTGREASVTKTEVRAMIKEILDSLGGEGEQAS